MRLNPPSWGFWAGRSPARAPRSGAGGGAGGGTPPPQRILRSCWAGEGLWAYQEGQMGQKMVCFAALSGTRSRQDASKEVHEAGRIRPSSGSNGGHVLSLYPLIWRSLRGGGAGQSCDQYDNATRLCDNAKVAWRCQSFAWRKKTAKWQGK